MDKTTRRRSKLKPIARKRHNFVYLLLAILLGISTSYIFLSYPPDYKIQISRIGIPIIPVFLLSLMAFIFCVITFLFIRKLQGLIFVAFTLFYIFIRQIGLTHWLFALLTISLFITVEIFVIKKK